MKRYFRAKTAPKWVLSSLLAFLSAWHVTAIAQTCSRPAAGLVGWWPGEGNANDIIGGNDGIFTGTYTSGEVNEAFMITSASTAVHIPATTAALNVGTQEGFTVEGWVENFDTSPEPVFEWGTTSAYGVHVWLNWPSSGVLYADVVDTSGGYHIFYSSSSIFTKDSFMHVALTYDEGSGMGILYLNGAVVASSSIGSITPQTSFDFYLGYRPYSTGTPFNGVIDEASLYDQALSASAIQAIYNAGSYGKCTCFNSPISLVGWWPGEGNANDIMNKNANGTNGGAYVAGEVGQAFIFNGTNQYMEIPDSAELDPTSALTVEAWAYVSGYPNVDLATIVSKQSPTVPGQLQYQLETYYHTVNNVPQFHFRGLVYLTANGGSYAPVEGATTVQFSTWYHLAVTYDGTNVNLYVNGKLDGSFSPNSGVAAGPVTSTTQPLYIGGVIGDANWCFNGRVDEVALYNSALSPAVIKASYNAGHFGRCVTQVPTNLDQRPRLDTDGNIVQAHDGMMVQFGKTFYLYGTSYGTNDGGSPNYNNNVTNLNNYTCYSSADLVNWKLESTNLLNGEQSFYVGAYYRPHVLYNANNHNYVLWYDWISGENAGADAACCGNVTMLAVATSYTPTGPFSIQYTQALSGAWDFDVFVDGNGTDAYIISTGNGIFIQALNAAYTGVVAGTAVSTGLSSEAPILFKRGQTYYAAATPLCAFCAPGAGVTVKQFTSLQSSGTGTANKTPDINNPNGTGLTIPAQETHVVAVLTPNGFTNIWMGDLWGTGPNWTDAEAITCQRNCDPNCQNCKPPPGRPGDRSRDQQLWTVLTFDDGKDVDALTVPNPTQLVLFNNSTTTWTDSAEVVAVPSTGGSVTLGNITATQQNPWLPHSQAPQASPILFTNLALTQKYTIQLIDTQNPQNHITLGSVPGPGGLPTYYGSAWDNPDCYNGGGNCATNGSILGYITNYAGTWYTGWATQ